MTTIKEIAASLGLSSATVSRTLRNDETLSITPETRSRILTAAEEMGYVRNMRRSPSKRQRTFLIIHRLRTFRNQIDSSYFFSIRSGIESACAKERIECLFADIGDVRTPGHSIDGILLIGNYRPEEYASLLTSYKGIPLTVIGIVSHYRAQIDQVSYRNFDSVPLALSYLWEMGHRKIGYLGFREASGTELFGSRVDAFTQFLQNRGILNQDWVHVYDFSDPAMGLIDAGYRLMTAIVEQGAPLPTAYFCANDPLALGAIRSLTEHGLSVPNDISVISHDGSFPSQYTIPPLTTVDVHTFQLGVEGVRMLLARLTDADAPARQLLLYPSLQERESVARLQ